MHGAMHDIDARSRPKPRIVYRVALDVTVRFEITASERPPWLTACQAQVQAGKERSESDLGVSSDCTETRPNYTGSNAGAPESLCGCAVEFWTFPLRRTYLVWSRVLRTH